MSDTKITGPHIVDGEFQSDKYPTCPPGKVPLSTKDPTAQDLLWEYAQRRRAVDAEFAADLEAALMNKGYAPPAPKADALTAKLTETEGRLAAAEERASRAYRIVDAALLWHRLGCFNVMSTADRELAWAVDAWLESPPTPAPERGTGEGAP